MSKPYRPSWAEGAGVAANARRELPLVAAAFFTEVRAMLEKDPPPSELHRLRLATKRLRYTLELFRGCYGPVFETRLKALRRIQQTLGELNDCIMAAKLLTDAAPARTFIERRAASKAAEFRKFWTQEFDAPGQELRWSRYLARAVRPR